MNIRTEHRSVKSEMLEHQWDAALLETARTIAANLSFPALVLFWLEEASHQSEKSFRRWMRDLSQLSKDELVDLFHEVGPEAGRRFVLKYRPTPLSAE